MFCLYRGGEILVEYRDWCQWRKLAVNSAAARRPHKALTDRDKRSINHYVTPPHAQQHQASSISLSSSIRPSIIGTYAVQTYRYISHDRLRLSPFTDPSSIKRSLAVLFCTKIISGLQKFVGAEWKAWQHMQLTTIIWKMWGQWMECINSAWCNWFETVSLQDVVVNSFRVWTAFQFSRCYK